MTNYAVLLQVFRITHSSFSVGLVGLAVAVPSVVVALVSGAVLDSLDLRRLVLAATSIQVVLSALLAVQAFADLRLVWLLYLLVALKATVGGMSEPARRTFMPRLLRRDQLAAGAALRSIAGHGSLTIGPALAGLVAAAFGLKVCYAVDAGSFFFSLYGVARLPALSDLPRSRSGARAAWEGFRFIFSEQAVLGALLADMSATFLGMPIALFPAINAERFGGNPETLGLMTTAVAVGGIVGSVLSGPVSRISRQGLGMLAGACVWGAGLVAFGFSHAFWIALVSLAVAGSGDVSAVVLRTAIVQGTTPEALRGRVSAAEFAVGTGAPQLGNFRAGVVASLSSPTASAVGGGLSTVIGAGLIAVLLPSFRRARRDGEPPGVSARRPEALAVAPAASESPISGR